MCQNSRVARPEGAEAHSPVTYGEYVNDAVGIGAPVFNSEGELAGSIGIIAPTIRLNSEELLKVQLEYVQKFAADLSRDIGYSPLFSSRA